MDWAHFATWLATTRMLAARTCTQYLRRAQQADRWTRAHRGRELAEVAGADLTAWVATLPATASTRNHAYKALRRAGAWMVDCGMRPDDPSTALERVSEPRGTPRPCPAPDRLLAAAGAYGPRADAFVHLLLYAGLRLSEARLLTWDRISERWIDVVGKGARSRTVPINDHLSAALARWRPHCDDPSWVFPSPQRPGQPVAEGAIRWWWHCITTEADLPGVTPHQCRHRYGTDLYRATRDLAVTQDALGHANPNTTRIYALVEPEWVAQAVGRLNYRRTEAA